MNNFRARTITGFSMVFLLLFSLWYNHWFLEGIFLVVVILGLWEFYTIFTSGNLKPQKIRRGHGHPHAGGHGDPALLQRPARQRPEGSLLLSSQRRRGDLFPVHGAHPDSRGRADGRGGHHRRLPGRPSSWAA